MKKGLGVSKTREKTKWFSRVPDRICGPLEVPPEEEEEEKEEEEEESFQGEYEDEEEVEIEAIPQVMEVWEVDESCVKLPPAEFILDLSQKKVECLPVLSRGDSKWWGGPLKKIEEIFKDEVENSPSQLEEKLKKGEKFLKSKDVVKEYRKLWKEIKDINLKVIFPDGDSRVMKIKEICMERGRPRKEVKQDGRE